MGTGRAQLTKPQHPTAFLCRHVNTSSFKRITRFNSLCHLRAFSPRRYCLSISCHGMPWIPNNRGILHRNNGPAAARFKSPPPPNSPLRPGHPSCITIEWLIKTTTDAYNVNDTSRLWSLIPRTPGTKPQTMFV